MTRLSCSQLDESVDGVPFQLPYPDLVTSGFDCVAVQLVRAGISLSFPWDPSRFCFWQELLRLLR
jgi:hypothetical protein